MELVKAHHEIMSPIDGEAILKHIELAGRLCYKSEDRITDESAKKFVRGLIKSGHHSVIEHYNVTVRFVCDRGCCYDKDTKVLTDAGWKYFYDVCETDVFYSLDDNGSIEKVKADKLIVKWFDGYMDEYKSTQVDLCVTPNHNMWVYDYDKRSKLTKTWKFIKSEDLTNKRYKFNKSANRIANSNESVYTIGGVDIHRGFYDKHYDSLTLDRRLFLELLGWWVTDGCVSYGKGSSGNRIYISQIKPAGRNRIEYILSTLGLSYYSEDKGFRINCPQLFQWLCDNFIDGTNTRKTYYLRLPRWFFSDLGADDLESFMLGVVGGDGTPHTGGPGYQIYTVSERFAEDLVEIALCLGLAANIYKVTGRDRCFPGATSKTHCSDEFVVSIVTTTDHLFNLNGDTKSSVYYNDYVYCVELPINHRLYVMRSGKPCWCGNSHELVRHRLAAYSQESTRYVSSVDKSRFRISTEEGVVSAYANGMSMGRIASLSNDVFTADDVRNVLINNGVDRRPVGNTGIMNESFFETIDTVEKSYLLGFIMADGNLRRSGNKQITVTQHKSHSWFLYRLLSDFVKPNISVSNDKMCHSFSLVSVKMWNDLFEKGIIPNKSHDFGKREADQLWGSVPSHLKLDFLRGLMDGDGCVRFFNQPNKGKTLSCLLLWLGPKELLEHISGFIRDNYGYECPPKKVTGTYSLHRVGITKPDIAKTFSEDMYRNFKFPYGHPIKVTRIAEHVSIPQDVATWGDPSFKVIYPSWFDVGDFGSWVWAQSMSDSEESYTQLTELGWSPQKARSVLPNSLKTEIVMTANLREWRHVFNLRCSKAAHPDIVALMKPLLKEFHERIPAVFDDLYEKYFC